MYGITEKFSPNFKKYEYQNEYSQSGNDLDHVFLPNNVFSDSPNLSVSYL